ncbi:MAG TPA: hypothetical protein VL326_35555 [Kofleriaceae bacterium]|nr:hypothetical protein [Kofleriaceae bacterium]
MPSTRGTAVEFTLNVASCPVGFAPQQDAVPSLSIAHGVDPRTSTLVQTLAGLENFTAPIVSGAVMVPRPSYP